MGQQGIDVSQQFAGRFRMVGRHFATTQQKAECALGVHQTQAYLAVGVFLACQFVQRILDRAVVVLKYQVAGIFQLRVNLLQCVSQVVYLDFEQ